MFHQQSIRSNKHSAVQNDEIPRLKISFIAEISKLEIDPIFAPIKSASSSQKISNSDEVESLSPQQRKSSSTDVRTIPPQHKLKKDAIDHRKPKLVAYNHEEHLSPSSSSNVLPGQPVSDLSFKKISNKQPSTLSVELTAEHFSVSSNQTDTLSPVIQVEQPLSPPLSQLIPDYSTLNDKQTSNRIANEQKSAHFLQPLEVVTFTPIDSSTIKSSPSIDDNSSSSNHVRYYQIGSIFTSTSTFLMHQNEVIAHANKSDPFLSDTIFIILIATLTIIILLFCLGLLCLCRRTTKRNISPSFDGGSYVGLNEHSSDIPLADYQQRTSKYENPVPYATTDLPSSSIQARSSINHPSLPNDRIRLPQTVALHHTAKQKVKMSEKKLKKKRVGFCCCHSKSTPSTTVNARRTRMRRNEM